MKTNKMQWLIDDYNNGRIKFLINKTGRRFGTIVVPTGGGKTGYAIEDIIWHIINSKPGDKIIFNISAPILKLCAQLVNDLFATLGVIFKDRWDEGQAMFFINSTADGRLFDEAEFMNVNVDRFTDIDKFFNSDARFAFVATCYKSMDKFADVVDVLSEKAEIHNYFDEGHLVVGDSRDDKRDDEYNDEERGRYDSFAKICRYSYSLYLLTATPDKEICQVVKKRSEILDGPFNGDNPISNKFGFIINTRPTDLIKSGFILQPKPHVRKVDTSEYEDIDGTLTKSVVINGQLCEEFMLKAKAESPEIHQKLLVSCGKNSHMLEVADYLQKRGWKVFMTSSKEGAKKSEDKEMIGIDEAGFIREVDSYDGDCFVLHIRQLIQGIDIKSLTGCVVYNASKVNDGVKRWIIQTVGRTLRPYAGERPENLQKNGLTLDDRKKKFGSVFIVIGGNVADDIEGQVGTLFQRYYGLDGYGAFTREAGKTGIKQKGKKVSGDHEDYGTGLNPTQSGLDETYSLSVRLGDLVKEFMQDHCSIYKIYYAMGETLESIEREAITDVKREAFREFMYFNNIDMDEEMDVFTQITNYEWNEKFLSVYGKSLEEDIHRLVEEYVAEKSATNL